MGKAGREGWKIAEEEANAVSFFMHLAVLTLELRLEYARSLKDRRQCVRSLKDSLRHGFNVSVTELDEVVVWQRATVGIAAISRFRRDYLRRDKCSRWKRPAFALPGNARGPGQRQLRGVLSGRIMAPRMVDCDASLISSFVCRIPLHPRF